MIIDNDSRLFLIFILKMRFADIAARDMCNDTSQVKLRTIVERTLNGIEIAN
jgi:hypothetical protein